MARIDPRVASRFEQDSERSNLKFVLATLPLAGILILFIVEAYQRPSKPFYNLPSYVTDDAVIRAAAEDSGALVPLMDMCIVVLSFCVAWACLCCYWLGFLRARHNMIEKFLDEGQPVRGNVVYEGRCWAFEFRYYGYVSYTPKKEPTEDSEANNSKAKIGPVVVRKRTRIFEPYTRELVPILCLPGYPKSGQGKEDLEYANLLALKNRPREVFLGRFALVWTIVCALVPVYILHQMRIIHDREFWAGIQDDYEDVDKGWIIYWLFLGVGILGVAMGGNALAWLRRRWWLLHQGTLTDGDLSIHGYGGAAAVTDSHSGEDYQQMRYP